MLSFQLLLFRYAARESRDDDEMPAPSRPLGRPSEPKIVDTPIAMSRCYAIPGCLLDNQVACGREKSERGEMKGYSVQGRNRRHPETDEAVPALAVAATRRA